MGKCFDRVKEALKGDIEAGVLDEGHLKRIEEYIESVKGEGLADGDFKGLSKSMNERYKSLKILNARLKYNYATDILRTKQFQEFAAQTHYDKAPTEAAASLLAGGNKGAKGERAGAYQNAISAKERYMRAVENLAEHKFLLEASDGKFDLEASRALWDMNNNPGADLRGYSEPSLKLAKTIFKVQQMILTDLQRVGAPVKALKNYIVKQSHNAEQLRSKGFEAWHDNIIGKLDNNTWANLKDKSDVGKRGFLKNIYDDIVSGRFEQVDKDNVMEDLFQLFTIHKAGARESAKASRHRSLHFKDAESWHGYNLEYGDRTLLASMWKSMDYNSRTVGIMSKMGTDSEKFLASMKNHLLAKHKDDQVMVDKINADFEKNGFVSKLYDEVRGLTSIPGKNTLAKTGRAMRSVFNMAHLGSVIFSTIPDIAAAAVGRSSGTGASLVGSYYDTITGIIRTLPSQAQREKFGKVAGLSSNHYLGTQYTDSSSGLMPEVYRDKMKEGQWKNDKVFGGIARAERLFMKVNLLEGQTSGMRSVIAAMHAIDLGESSHLGFDGLNETLRFNLGKYDITAKEWEVIRKASILHPEDNSLKVINAESIEALDPELFNKLIPSSSSKSNKRFLSGDKARAELATKVQNFVTDAANTYMRIPDARAKTHMHQGYKSGTWQGEALRFLFQYKSFALMNAGLIKRIKTSSPNARSANYMLGQFIVGSWGLGMASMWLRDLAKNQWPPKKPDLQFAADSLMRSGALGLYGDVILTDYSRYGVDLGRNFLGPMGSFAIDAAKVGAEVGRKGPFVAGDMLEGFSFSQAVAIRKAKSAVKDTFNLAADITPGGNLFWTKWALDQVIHDNIMEQIDPEFKARQLQKQIRSGQRKIIDLD